MVLQIVDLQGYKKKCVTLTLGCLLLKILNPTTHMELALEQNSDEKRSYNSLVLDAVYPCWHFNPEVITQHERNWSVHLV